MVKYFTSNPINSTSAHSALFYDPFRRCVTRAFLLVAMTFIPFVSTFTFAENWYSDGEIDQSGQNNRDKNNRDSHSKNNK